MERVGAVLIPLVALGAIVLLGAVYARRSGHLASRTSKLVVVVIVAIIALVIWLGPGYVSVAD